MFLDQYLKLTIHSQASDLHLKVGSQPMMRRHGELMLLSSALPVITQDAMESMVVHILDESQIEQFKKNKDIDVAYGLSGIGRFRINVFQQRGTFRMVIRAIPDRVPSFADLNLPNSLKAMAEKSRGLTLITGATGSGKSSTMAAIIDYINTNFSKHIIMIEDPTEFLIKDQQCMITQRELGIDTISFAQSLKAALRQDPDVILIGEMRDPETMEIALQAAETGHLVLSTLHTLDAHETINRILSAFDSSRQMQFRLQLASVLNSIVSQRLVRSVDGQGFYPALEIMINNKRIKDLITFPEKTHMIQDAIESGKNAYGMQSFDQCLLEMVANQKITVTEAMRHCTNPENFKVRMSGITSMDQKSWQQNTSIRRNAQKSWQEIQEIELEDEMEKTMTRLDSNIRMSGIKKRSRDTLRPTNPLLKKKKKA